jgi:AraC-like DNA-binding protein
MLECWSDSLEIPVRSAAKLPKQTPRRTEPTPARGAETLVAELAAMLAAIERFSELEDSHRLARAAVEFARNAFEIERVGLYVVESTEPSITEPSIVMRGTWGTNDRGILTDERGLAHGFERERLEQLLSLHRRGELWIYRAFEPRSPDRRCLPWTREDRDWLATTPLVAGGTLVGVFYNDTAISKTALDAGKQANLAVFASLLAEPLRERVARGPLGKLAGLARDASAPQPLDGANPPTAMVSRFIHKVVAELELDPQLSGEQLARRFRVSPGHLARTFKAEVGTSLVDYRNRMRLERFFTLMRAGESTLNEAALQAGFGSYAQFIRVHRQITGVVPSEFEGAQSTNFESSLT